uniref:Uncharacterized protein n=1 Tax=Aplanochytrium stocchinoi TaxID=215587 RepID=A0A7S3PNG2_9STRA
MNGVKRFNSPAGAVAGHLYVRLVDCRLRLPLSGRKINLYKTEPNSVSNATGIHTNLCFDCELLVRVGEESHYNSSQLRTIRISKDALKRTVEDNDLRLDLESGQNTDNDDATADRKSYDTVLEISDYYGQMPVSFILRCVRPKYRYSYRGRRRHRHENSNPKSTSMSTVGQTKVALADTLIDLRQLYMNMNIGVHKLQLDKGKGGWIKVELQFCRAPYHIKGVGCNHSGVRFQNLGVTPLILNDSEVSFSNLLLTIQHTIEQKNSLLIHVLIRSLVKYNASLARRLLSNRANHPRHMTVFDLACERGSELVLRALLQAGSDMIMREWMSNTTRSKGGLSDIHFAVIGGDVGTVETICALKCEWIHRRRKARSLWSQFEQFENEAVTETEHNVFIEGEDFVNNTDDKGNTPLMYAVQQKNNDSLKLVRTLINYSADVSICNRNNDTPLLLAVKSDNTEIIKFLLSLRDNLPQGIHVSKCKPNMPNLQSEYPLLIACKLGNLDAFEALLRCGAVPNVTDGNGTTALHFAAQIGSMNIVQMLVENVTKQCFHTRICSYSYVPAETEEKTGADGSNSDSEVLASSVSRSGCNNNTTRNLIRKLFRATKHRSRAVRSVSIDVISKTLTIPTRAFGQGRKNNITARSHSPHARYGCFVINTITMFSFIVVASYLQFWAEK